MNKDSKNIKRLFICAAVLVLAGMLLIAVLSRAVELPAVYLFQSEAISMPDTDDDFVDWLHQQPGIVENTVVVYREDGVVYVKFASLQTASGDPPLPDITSKAREMGYVLEESGFQERLPDNE